MRPAIGALLSRLARELRAQTGSHISVAREDLTRLVRWVLAGDKREVNAYVKGADGALKTIGELMAGSSAHSGVHVCCRRATDRIKAYIAEDTRRWRISMMDRAAAAEAEVIQRGAPPRRSEPAR